MSYEEAREFEARQAKERLLNRVNKAMKHTRDSDPETSKRAARQAKAGLSKTQNMVLSILKEHPEGLGDSEIRQIANARFGFRPESSYRKRRSDLARLGLVVETGTKRLNEHGSQELVWRALTDEEIAARAAE